MSGQPRSYAQFVHTIAKAGSRADLPYRAFFSADASGLRYLKDIVDLTNRTLAVIGQNDTIVSQIASCLGALAKNPAAIDHIMKLRGWKDLVDSLIALPMGEISSLRCVDCYDQIYRSPKEDVPAAISTYLWCASLRSSLVLLPKRADTAIKLTLIWR